MRSGLKALIWIMGIEAFITQEFEAHNMESWDELEFLSSQKDMFWDDRQDHRSIYELNDSLRNLIREVRAYASKVETTEDWHAYVANAYNEVLDILVECKCQIESGTLPQFKRVTPNPHLTKPVQDALNALAESKKKQEPSKDVEELQKKFAEAAAAVQNTEALIKRAEEGSPAAIELINQLLDRQQTRATRAT